MYRADRKFPSVALIIWQFAMPRLRSNKKTARYDPLFGPAQDGNTAPGYNVPRGITFEELRQLTNRARQSGGSPISVKNQIRAVVAAAGLTSAAAGALTLRAYQYVDQTFGKRPRGSDVSETNADHSRLRGVKEPRTIDPELPSYEEVSSREDEFVEETGEKFGNAVETAFTLEDDDDAMQQIAEQERQEAEDQGVRNVLLSMYGDTGDFVVDASDQNRQSFDDLPSGAQTTSETEPIVYQFEDTMPHRIDDDTTMSDAPVASDSNAVALRSSGEGRRNAGNQETVPRPLKPMFPFHNTTQSILEYHFSSSMNDIPRSGATELNWRFRMNTYVQPLANNTNNQVNQVNWSVPIRGVSRQAVGRYVMAPGSTGSLMEENRHRALTNLDDNQAGVYTAPEPAGADWYNATYQAYTVTKCEWTIYIDFPWHHMKSTANQVTPTPAEIQQGLVANAAWDPKPPHDFKLRAFTHYTSSGDTITEVNPPLTQPTIVMERWNNTFENKVTIPCQQARVIKGTWYPGKVKHNPINDADMEIWTPVNNVPTTGHLEHLVFQLCDSANSGTVGQHYLCANVSFNFRWHVQWRDQKAQIQYPSPGQADITLPISDIVFQEDPALNV